MAEIKPFNVKYIPFVIVCDSPHFESCSHLPPPFWSSPSLFLLLWYWWWWWWWIQSISLAVDSCVRRWDVVIVHFSSLLLFAATHLHPQMPRCSFVPLVWPALPLPHRQPCEMKMSSVGKAENNVTSLSNSTSLSLSHLGALCVCIVCKTPPLMSERGVASSHIALLSQIPSKKQRENRARLQSNK